MGLYVITGATGNTGKPVALGLLQQGHQVRIISRTEEKAKELVAAGAELFLGDTTDYDLCVRAFTGAFAVYMMVPPDMMAADYTAHQIKHIDAMVAALIAAGVKYVVSLSSIGAHLPEKGGVVQGLHTMEEALNAIPDMNVVHLRAGYFMENLFGQIAAIRQMNAMASPVKADLAMPLVATRDIAQTALHLLADLKFVGKTHQYVLGSRNANMEEVAAIIGGAIGKTDLKYFVAPPEQAKQAMVAGGMSENFADKMLEFVQSCNDGLVLNDVIRDEHNTTATSLEDFAQVFSVVFMHS